MKRDPLIKVVGFCILNNSTFNGDVIVHNMPPTPVYFKLKVAIRTFIRKMNSSNVFFVMF